MYVKSPFLFCCFVFCQSCWVLGGGFMGFDWEGVIVKDVVDGV